MMVVRKNLSFCNPSLSSTNQESLLVMQVLPFNCLQSMYFLVLITTKGPQHQLAEPKVLLSYI